MILPPPEPSANASLNTLAPQFASAVMAILAELGDATPSETLRSDERQAWLYGMGRDYDDGRGIVTHAPTGNRGWHKFGLAADLIHQTLGWDAPDAWWVRLGECAERHGCTWGGRWHQPDRQHIQWGKCRVTPSTEAATIFTAGGFPAIWAAVGAA